MGESMKKKRKSKYDKRLSELFEDFIDDCKLKNLTLKSIENYEYNCNIFIEAIGDIQVKDLEQSVLDDFLKWLKKNRNYNATSTNTMLIIINVYLHFLYEKGFIHKQIKFNRIKCDKKVKEIYTNEELKIILRKPSDDCLFSEYRNYLLAHLIMNLGIRVRTLSEIQIKDVDMKERVIVLHAMKNRKETFMPIPKNLFKILKQYFDDYEFEPTDYLICDDKGRQMKPSSISVSFKRYCRNRGVYKEGSVHLLRHTFSTHFIKNGGSIYALSKILGHSSIAITENYIRTLSIEHFTDDLEKFSPLDKLKG